MVMTIAKITAGDGYTYLTRHTARGDTDPGTPDAASYYTASGNPPGRWTGRSAPLLGLEGKEVTEEQMRALFGYGQHPDAEQMIPAWIDAHTRPDMTAVQQAQLHLDAIKAATLGRPFPEYEPLPPFEARVNRRLAVIAEQTGRDPTQAEIKKIQREEARRQRAAVAGFDLVFSPVKSAALLWAVDERPQVRDAIRAAHEDALNTALGLLEDHAAYTRTGTGGIAQIATRGLIAAAFEHWDSRAGDPNLHTHVAISAKVQGTDGVWRALDARGLYRMTVAASETYNTAFEAALSARLGVTFTTRPDTRTGREPVREISGVPLPVIEFFSRRRAAIEARYGELVRQFRQLHGRDPSPQACHQLARQANLDTRQGKQPPRALAGKRQQWRAELLERFGASAVRTLMTAVPAPGAVPEVPAVVPDTAGLAERVVAGVAAARSTWTVWNLRAEAERLIRCTGAAGHRGLAAEVTDRAVALCVSTEPPALLDEPAGLRRADGSPVFTQHAAARYTSAAVLDAEDRLVRACATPTAAGLSGPSAAAALDGYEARSGTGLDAGQRHLVTAFSCDTRLLLAGLGPAGSGKTTAMRALAWVLRQGGRRLVPLATSAAAADVLGRELGTPAENLHKFLHEWSPRGTFSARLRAGGTVPAAARLFALHPGDLVLVDEAGMAGTFALDELVSIASSRGAVVRLLGDDRQLSAVECGGALRLIAAQPGTPELSVLYRFRDRAEATATLALRTGDSTAIDWYLAQDRIVSGSRDAMTQAAYDGWKTDMLAGKITLMAAGSSADVTALSARARADRVTAGHVEPGGVTLADGNLAGRGDWIVTRVNHRLLGVHHGQDWVKNGDSWLVLNRHADGSLRVEHTGHHGRVILPAAYVATNVELLYATTAHRAEGATVDTAHPLITAGMTREMLYVLASRAREKTTLYVATHDQPFDTDPRVDKARCDPRSYIAREILHNVIATEGAELSATETIRVAQDEASSLATLVPRYLHAAHQLAGQRYRDAALAVFGDDAAEVAEDRAWSAVVAKLYDAEMAGWDPRRLLESTAASRELGTADSIAEVMCHRIDAFLAGHPAPPRGDQPYESGAVVRARLSRVVSDALGPSRSAHAQAEPAWPALITALRHAETDGHDAAELITAIVSLRELRTARSISETLAWRIERYVAATAPPEPAPSPGRPARPPLLPWAGRPPSEPGHNLGTYLEEAADLITARISQLADEAIAHRPAWMTLLGDPPGEPGPREEWRHQVAVIAAYRDQYQVTTDDPRQILGPYAEPGHAGHRAYWLAAGSVLAARQLARLSIPRESHAGASAVYHELSAEERASIATTMASRLGPLWFGHPHEPDEDAVTQTGYEHQLTEILTERGILGRVRAARPRTRVDNDEPVEAALARRGTHTQRVTPGPDTTHARRPVAAQPADRRVEQPPRGLEPEQVSPSDRTRLHPCSPDARPEGPSALSQRTQPSRPAPGSSHTFLYANPPPSATWSPLPMPWPSSQRDVAGHDAQAEASWR